MSVAGHQTIIIRLALVGVIVGLSQTAAAQPLPGDRYYLSERQTPGPERGYSGFVWTGPGARSVYCDYQRIPNRVCTYTRDGRERCRIKGWTLRQHCY